MDIPTVICWTLFSAFLGYIIALARHRRSEDLLLRELEHKLSMQPFTRPIPTQVSTPRAPDPTSQATTGKCE